MNKNSLTAGKLSVINFLRVRKVEMFELDVTGLIGYDRISQNLGEPNYLDSLDQDSLFKY
jgi:hypothetical protein